MLRLSLCALATAALAAGGCTRRNEDFCCTTTEACQRNGGDGELVRCQPDSDRPYCDNQSRTCIEPPGEPCGPDGECTTNERPICYQGLCVECGTAADCPFSLPVCAEAGHQCESCEQEGDCAAFDGRPYCDQGTCVGCRDGGDCAAAAPICDQADGTCRGCRAGSECASDVCDWIDGECVADDDVLYVAVDGTGSDCTRDDPCGSIADALAAAGSSRNWILMAAGSYQETVVLSGVTVRIVGDGADLTPATVDVPAFDIREQADVGISGLHIHDADGNGDGPGDGVYCTNTGGASTLVLDRVLIEGNDDQGIDANGCNVTVARSTITENLRGGIAFSSVDFDVTNNFIYVNGSGTASAGILVEENPPTRGRLEHNTIVANLNPAGTPSGVRCLAVGALLQFKNNIIYDNQGSASQIEGENCEHTYSVIGPNRVSGEGNTEIAPTFVGETNFHLVAGSSGIDAAAATDIPIDFDGQPRPGGDANDIGADELDP
jgi:hypothetical protein